jgi:hypothetical protein
LVVRAEQDLPGTEGGKAKREGEVEEGRVWEGESGEMSQTMYAHVNKWKKTNFKNQWDLKEKIKKKKTNYLLQDRRKR